MLTNKQHIQHTWSVASKNAAFSLWPVNPSMFDGNFEASAVTDIPEITDDHDTSQTEDSEAVPQTSTAPSSPLEDTSPSNSSFVLPGDMRPIPKVDASIERQKRSGKNRAGKAAILTSSPYLKELTKGQEIEELKRQLKETKAELRQVKKHAKGFKAGSDLKAKSKPSSSKSVDTGAEVVTIKSRKRLKFKNEKPKKKNLATVELDPEIGPELEEGKFILVKFRDPNDAKGKGKPVYYVGHITSIKGDMVSTKFLRRADLKKRDSYKSSYPDEHDIAIHPREDIALFLNKTVVDCIGTARTKSLLVFDDPRLSQFQPIY